MSPPHYALLLIQLRRPHPPLLQHRLPHLPIPRNKPDAKVPRNSHQRTLDSIVIYVIRIWWVRYTSLNLIQTEQTEQRSIDEFACYQSAGTGSGASAEGEVRGVDVGSWCVERRWGGEGSEPAFGVEGCGCGTEVVGVCGLLVLLRKEFELSIVEERPTVISSLSVDQHHRPLRYNSISPPHLVHRLTR